MFGRKIKFFSRNASSAPAVGAMKLHKIEEAELMAKIFNMKTEKKG